MHAEIKSRIRERLAGLGDMVHEWRTHLRAQHLGAGLVEDDWIEAHCSLDAAAQHQRYLREYWREVLLTGDPSAVVFSDNPCRSAYLTERKRARFEKYGPFEPLFFNPETRHLVELSNGAQYLSRINERSTDIDIELFASRLRTAENRLSSGRHHHAVAAAKLQSDLHRSGTGEREATELFASHLAAQPLGSDVAIARYRLISRRETLAVRFRCIEGVDLVAAVVAGARDGDAWTASLGWRFAGSDEDDCTDEKGGTLHLDELVPFSRYAGADSVSELAFSFVAFGELAKVVVPPLSRAIFEAVSARKET